ncbi:FtsX-like permease family protein [Bacillus sp. AK128]
MSINQLIFRNLKKNVKNYYLYVFALVFSVALYFAFVTLQYDPALDETKGSIKGAAAIRTGSILLVWIVTIFLIYANNLFIKQRSKEIGLFQLIGMTRSKIFRILTIENFLLYFCSLGFGIFIGFSFSKLMSLILFKIVGVNEIARLHFSVQAFTQTLIVFGIIFLLMMIMNYSFIKRQTILSLFHVTSRTENRTMHFSMIEMLVGVVGIALILIGYYISSKLFTGDFTELNELFLAMTFILASVIIGTYLFYKGSVGFISNLVRKRKKGYLAIHEVLSLSTIMFRIKSNSFLLTVITTLSALAIGLLSLSYISYYGAEKMGSNNVPADFSLTNEEDAVLFKKALEENEIKYGETRIEVLMAIVDASELFDITLSNVLLDPAALRVPVISDRALKDIDVNDNEMIFTGYSDILRKFMPMEGSGSIIWKGQKESITQTYLGLNKEYVISWYFTNGGIPTAIVDDSIFHRLKADQPPDIQGESSIYIGISISDQNMLQQANELFQNLFTNTSGHHSQLDLVLSQKNTMGLMMFIVGFLGLTFLVTSGCILYFKQMGEGEEEKGQYTILRKLGFTREDLLKGIQVRQLFSFGIPLVLGLFHSYFAVQSGWFLFGTELWTPMILVMILYTALYSIFILLSVLYYKKVIREAL